MGNRGIAPPILNIGYSWRSVDKFKPVPLTLGYETPVTTKHKAGWTPKSV